jgi:hypothetical protein
MPVCVLIAGMRRWLRFPHAMKTAVELIHVNSFLTLWEMYDSRSKVDCYSSAVLLEQGWCVVDPVPLDGDLIHELLERAPIRKVVCTSCNHERDCLAFAREQSAGLFASPDAIAEFDWRDARPLADGCVLEDEIVPVEFSGAAPGEFSIVFPSIRHAAIGDAIINLSSTGLSFLPAKYCVDPKQLSVSLRKLLNYCPDTVSFAHGPPLVANAASRLETLIL